MNRAGAAPPFAGGEMVWRFRGDARPIRGATALEVVYVLRLRCQVGFDPAVAVGPLAPFCSALAARSGAFAVPPDLCDQAAASALLDALVSVGEAARVYPGCLRLV